MDRSYADIANDFDLWGKHADPTHLFSRDDFEKVPLLERIDLIVECYGDEEPLH